ncbi:unnamed protein product [Fraxinus pennsylvanica]|uniref:FAR1 domain-containing protein n=1 Tax=Fraxinus pennsylvanica TaxID=56036 RepID=A0AAD2E5Q3_9LAMI|nr:unnamed protein product [Fraxinus pennsylvanica]
MEEVGGGEHCDVPKNVYISSNYALHYQHKLDAVFSLSRVIPRSGGEVVDEIVGSNEVLIEELEKKLLEQVVYSEEEAYMLYCDYAQAMGFSVRRGKQYYFMGTKRVRTKSYCRSKEGYKDYKVDALTYKKPETRTGCKAMICFGCDDNGQWKVTRFFKDHNHEMAPAYSKPSLRSGQAILTATIYGNGGVLEPSMVNAVH